ncbi:MAG: tyrosine-type recombinase/integrase [Phycisphaerae bacterium]
MSRAGRPPANYRTSWGEIIIGLSRGTDLRWRIIKTGQKFTEHDETLAIKKFREMTSSHKPMATLTVVDPVDPLVLRPVSFSTLLDENENKIESTFDYRIDETAVWSWVKQQLINDPITVSVKLGIPEIRNLSAIKVEKDIQLSELLAEYLKRQPNKRTSRHSGQAFEKFMKVVQVTSVMEMTTEKLLEYRQKIESSNLSPSTKNYYFSRVKIILSNGIKYGFNANVLRQALDRCRVLFTSEKQPPKNPTPISREDFHKLFNSANSQFKAILLISLNCCLHLGETMALTWDEFDVKRRCHISSRRKTGIARAAMLWDETLTALQGVRKTNSPYVFVSYHGSKYNRATAGNLFSELRDKAGVSAAVKFDDIRDGAYTAATLCGQDSERLSRLLAGHSNYGLMDSYVKRNPEMVKPATDAVYKHYFG